MVLSLVSRLVAVKLPIKGLKSCLSSFFFNMWPRMSWRRMIFFGLFYSVNGHWMIVVHIFFHLIWSVDLCNIWHWQFLQGRAACHEEFLCNPIICKEEWSVNCCLTWIYPTPFPLWVPVVNPFLITANNMTSRSEMQVSCWWAIFLTESSHGTHLPAFSIFPIAFRWFDDIQMSSTLSSRLCYIFIQQFLQLLVLFPLGLPLLGLSSNYCVCWLFSTPESEQMAMMHTKPAGLHAWLINYLKHLFLQRDLINN